MPLHACVIYALVVAPYSLIEPAIALISGLLNTNSRGSRPFNAPITSHRDDVNRDLKTEDIIVNGIIDNLQRRNANRNHSATHLLESRGARMIIALKHSVGLIIVTYILQHFALSHPFLLADNRFVLYVLISKWMTDGITH